MAVDGGRPVGRAEHEVVDLVGDVQRRAGAHAGDHGPITSACPTRAARRPARRGQSRESQSASAAAETSSGVCHDRSDARQPRNSRRTPSGAGRQVDRRVGGRTGQHVHHRPVAASDDAEHRRRTTPPVRRAARRPTMRGSRDTKADDVPSADRSAPDRATPSTESPRARNESAAGARMPVAPTTRTEAVRTLVRMPGAAPRARWRPRGSRGRRPRSPAARARRTTASTRARPRPPASASRSRAARRSPRR